MATHAPSAHQGKSSAQPIAAGGPADRSDPAYQAFLILRTAFTIAPIVFGLDKFFDVLTDWDRYLSGPIDTLSPLSTHNTMLVVGVIEIVAGIVVWVHPKFGGWLVAAWLVGIIINLLLIPGFYDVGLRDFGLFLAAVALQRLATRFDPHDLTWPISGK